MTYEIPQCNNTSVGMIARKDDKILLIERKKPPFGFAAPAGHVDDGEEFEDAAKRELFEEVGLQAAGLKLLAEGRKENPCRRPGGSWHYWKIYEVEIENDTIERSKDETKQVGWYSVQQIKDLLAKTDRYLRKEISEDDWQKSPGIEPVWAEWFEQIGII